MALTPDGEWVLSGSKDRGVQFWNPRTGDTQLMLQGHKNSGATSVLNWLRSLLITVNYLVISVAPSPKGELFATGSGDMRARIWKYVIPAYSPYMVTAYLWRIITDMELIGDPRQLSSKNLGLEEMDKLYLQSSYNPFSPVFREGYLC